MPDMKMTVEIPDELARAIKIKAAEEGYKMKDLITVMLKSALAMPTKRPKKFEKGKLILPLVQCKRGAPISTMSTQEIYALMHQALEETDLGDAKPRMSV